MNLDKLWSALQRVGTTRNRRAHGARKPRRATSQPRLEHLEGRVLFSVQPVGVTFAPIELLAFSGTVATFTSNDPTPQSASNYSAAIVWGDGTTTAGTVAANGSGGFNVSGTHTYAEDGSLPVDVRIADAVDATNATAASTATVHEFSLSITGTPLATTEGQALSGTVATFRDPGSPDPASEFAATIDWGDGTTTAGTISGSAGNYTISGNHTYADEGTHSATVTAVENNTPNFSVSITDAVNVAEADTLANDFIATGTIQEHEFVGGVAAVFRDNGYPTNSPSDFTASFDWGDGTVYTTADGNAFVTTDGAGDVTLSVAGHTYADEGTYTVVATLGDDAPSGVSISNTGTLTATEADTLTGNPMTFSATEGTAFSGAVATFTDTSSGDASDFTAAIDWGDGTTTAGTVSGAQGGPFTVSGSHTYADEGTFTPQVTLTEDAPGTASATATSQATVDEGDVLTPAGQTITPVESVSFTGNVATFSDTNTANTAGDFAATINWGDGTTTAGTVSGGGSFTISGSHTYADEGSFTVTSIITDDAPGTASATATGTAAVAETDTLIAAATQPTIATAEATSISGAVAVFTDANSSNVAGDFTAAIDWGDGTTSAGTVTGGAGSFTVSSSHTYADEGSFTVKATLTDDAPGSATATASNTATVAETDVLTTAASQPTIAAIEGNSFSGAVAVFNDSNNANVAGDFTAAIDWGDGTTTAGTVSGGSGAFTASGSHTYAEDGSFTVSVTLADDAPGTAAATAKVTATISEAALVATGVTVNGFELAPLTSATVATFTHSGAAEPAANFTATINWGDGTASAGTITLSGTTYTVQASHTYTDERTFAVSVNVTDDTAAATANTSAVILEELLPNGTRGTANQRFVSEVYRDMLGRKVDASGLAAWSALLDTGTSQFQVVRLIQTDPHHEFLFREVDQLYRQYLHRASDPGGANAAVQFLAQGGTVEQLATILATSPEFNQGQTNGSNDSWLNAFYLDALGRQVDPGGQAAWDHAFAGGATRAQVAAGIFGSDEYHRDLVSAYYLQVLDRTADAGGLAGWSNLLKQGVRDEVVLANIMDTDSHEFFNKTAP
ncbi:MAG: DUF4214 domain-containing protein [Planctomycetota bacterium]|nr:MAG: DUF4214 domain-containing protein [Planctomycetota bacterium]